MKKQIVLADFISSIVLLLMLYAALSKLSDIGHFKFVLARSPLLKPIAHIIAWVIPVSEILIAILLIVPITRTRALLYSIILLSVFTIYLTGMLLFSSDVPCSCGGVIQKLSWPQHIIFNLFFISLSISGIVLYKKHKEAMQRTPP